MGSRDGNIMRDSLIATAIKKTAGECSWNESNGRCTLKAEDTVLIQYAVLAGTMVVTTVSEDAGYAKCVDACLKTIQRKSKAAGLTRVVIQSVGSEGLVDVCKRNHFNPGEYCKGSGGILYGDYELIIG